MQQQQQQQQQQQATLGAEMEQVSSVLTKRRY